MRRHSGPVVLLYPPPSDPTQPYTSLPTLTSHLRARGYTVVQRDLGIEVLTSMLSAEEVARAALAVSRQATGNGAAEAPDSDRLARIRRLLPLSGYLADNVERAVRLVRDREAFYDLERYRWATSVIETSCDLVSLPYHPARLRPNGFEMPVEFTFEGLLTACRDRRHNLFLDRFARVVDEVLALDPLLVGISITYHFQVIPGFTLARLFKDASPGTHICLGGAILHRMEPHLLHDPQAFVFADTYVVGEGETALESVAGHLEAGRTPGPAPNLIRSVGGRAEATNTSFVENVRALQCPDFDGLPLDRYLSPEPVFLLASTRGCYWGKCTFCDVSRMTRSVYRPVGRSAFAGHVLELHRRFGVRRFFFCDDAMPLVNMREMARLVTEQLPDVTWQAEVRFERAMTDEFIAEMKAGGCRQLIYGFESHSQRVLDLMHKANTVETDERIVASCQRHGIALNLQSFIGLPGETRQEAESTVQFLIDHERAIASFGFGVFTLYPDTPIYKEPEAHGVTRLRCPLKDRLLAAVEFDPLSGMSPAEANACHDEALERLSAIYATRTQLLGGASGAHSLLQCSAYDSETLYAQWREADLGSERSGVPMGGEGLMVLSPEVIVSEADDAGRRVVFDGLTARSFELEDGDMRLLLAFSSPRGATDALVAWTAHDPGSSLDEVALTARGLMTIDFFCRQGLVMAPRRAAAQASVGA